MAIGAKEGAVNFYDFVRSSAYGVSESLWVFAQYPVDQTACFVNACYEATECAIDFCQQLNLEDIEEKCVEEFQYLQDHYSSLDDAGKGELIGRVVGKFGTDILIPGTIVKGISVCKKLKEANRICNFESMLASTKNRKIIAEEALKHAKARENNFKNVKLHVDKQNKHVPGKHNYQEGKSIFEHQEPQRLLSDFAGKGTPVANRKPGAPDYREYVDFGEFIGYHVDLNTGKKTATTCGEIRYSNSGAHIVPVLRRGNL